MENEKAKLETSLHELKFWLEPVAYEDVAYIFAYAMAVAERNTEEFRTFIQQFVKAIHVRPMILTLC